MCDPPHPDAMTPRLPRPDGARARPRAKPSSHVTSVQPLIEHATTFGAVDVAAHIDERRLGANPRPANVPSARSS